MARGGSPITVKTCTTGHCRVGQRQWQCFTAASRKSLHLSRLEEPCARPGMEAVDARACGDRTGMIHDGDPLYREP
jgi:hypothetical protein